MNYLNVGYVTYFDYASLVIMIILIISYYLLKHLDSIQNRMLKVMLYSHLIVILMDIMNVMGPRFGLPFMQQILYGTHLCYFIMHSITIFAFFFYCCCLVDHYGNGNPWLQFAGCLPMFCFFVLMILNYWTGWIFKVDEALLYYRGPAILAVYAIAGFYVILSLIFISIYRKKVSGLQRMVTYLYIFLCAAGVVIQYFNPKLLVESFGMTVALMTLFFTTARFSELYDENFKVLNKRAFLNIIDSSMNWPDSSFLIFVKAHDIQIYRLALGKDFQENLIRTVIQYLQQEIPDVNVFHYSNSQFVLMLKHDAGEEAADAIVNEIAAAFNGIWQIGDNEIRCAYHVGKLPFGKEEEINNADKLKECLDYINDYSKRIDNQILTLKDLKIGAVARSLMIQRLLREAVDQDGFEMYYQPIYSVNEKKIVSAEALIRLKNTEHGFISPEEFIPIAEQNGLIMKIGEFAFRSVCRFIQENDIGRYGIRFIEVNLSVVQCMQEKLYKQLTDIMEEYGVNPDKINLEITETAEATRMGAFQDNVFALTEKGISFSLDDYGTGYSNIGFLYKFPFKIVKIDKSLLWGAFENEKAMITLISSIELAKNLNLQVVVEGVENEEHLDKLVELGCEYLQGYYFSKPIPKDDFLNYVSDPALSV